MKIATKALAALAFLVSASVGAAGVAADEGDAESGATLFKRKTCANCHQVTGDQEAAKQGPTLECVIGRKAGTTPGFDKFSPAIIAADVTWDMETLDTFLTKPKALIPGTKMVIAVPKEDDREDLLAYLAKETQTDRCPLE